MDKNSIIKKTEEADPRPLTTSSRRPKTYSRSSSITTNFLMPATVKVKLAVGALFRFPGNRGDSMKVRIYKRGRMGDRSGAIILVTFLLIVTGCAMGNMFGSSSKANRAEVKPTTTATRQAHEATAASSPASSTALDSVPVEHLTGQWEGVYFVYPQPMGMKVQLRSIRENAVEGELAFYPLNTNQRNILGTIRGKYVLKGKYDPLTQTFELSPGHWIEKPNRLVFATTLRAVLSVQRQEIAGFLVSRLNQNFPAKMHFVMARPQYAQERLTEPMIKAVAKGGHGFGRFFGSSPSDGDLLKWASMLKTEYPDMDLGQTVMGTLLGRARNLFEDDHFSKYFGKRFDQMSPSDRAAVVDSFRRAQGQAGRSPLGSFFRGESSDDLKQYAFLEGAFSSTGTDSAAEITLSVLTHRVIRSWRDAMQDRMRVWPAKADVFKRLARIETAGKDRLITLWPSERKEFKATLSAARQRLAVPVLGISADQTVAQAKGYQGIRDLAGWSDRNKDIAQYASGAELEALTAKIDVRLQQLLKPMIAAETVKLISLGEGYAAVAAGNRWYRDFTGRYGFLEDRPIIRGAVDRLALRRSSDLKAAQDQIAAQLKSAKTAQGIDNLIAVWLPVPGDHRTSAGENLVKIAGERKQRIALENKYSDKEIALMKARPGIVDVPERPDKPTPEEIGLAILREIAALGGEQVSRTVGHYSVPPANMIGVYCIIELRRVNLLGVAPVGDGSYMCKYSFKAHFSFPRKYLDSFGISASPVYMRMFDTYLQLMNSMKPVLIDQFALTSDGWRSPTINQRGLNAMFKVQQSWAAGLNRAVQQLLP
jgi:hypothetical protein